MVPLAGGSAASAGEQFLVVGGDRRVRLDHQFVDQ
jgi:hypothetical protein